MQQKRFHAYAELVFVGILWGFAATVIKVTLEEVPTIPFLTLRFAFSSLICLLTLNSIKHLFTHGRNTTLLVFAYSILSTVIALGAIFKGLETTTVLNLSVVQATGPLLLAFIGSFVFREHHTLRQKIGTFLAVIGTAITLIEPIVTSSISGSLVGNVYLAVYIATDVISVLMLKTLLKKRVDPFALTNFSFFIGFLGYVVIVLTSSKGLSQLSPLLTLTPLALAGIVYMAYFSGTIAFGIRARAQRTISVGDAGLFGYLTPLFSTFFAVILISEQVTPLFLSGALVTTFGVIIAEYRRPHKHPPLIKK